MSNLWLTVQVSPGAHIAMTCDEAVELADKTGLAIWFDFNGVRCLARPGDNPRGIEADWNKKMEMKGDHRIASDHGETPNAKLKGGP